MIRPFMTPPLARARAAALAHGPVPLSTYPECLGPLPVAALSALVDLGLSDLDIAVYFGLEFPEVAALTRRFRALARRRPS